MFNETPISPRKCRVLLTKLVYLLGVGETFGTQEATTLFFGVTKLFQHKDVSLPRLRYAHRNSWPRTAPFELLLVENSLLFRRAWAAYGRRGMECWRRGAYGSSVALG